MSSLCEDQDRRCPGGMEDMGQARVRPAGFEITLCVFAGVAGDCCFVLHLPVLSSSANPDLNCFFGVFFVAVFGFLFVLFSFYPDT